MNAPHPSNTLVRPNPTAHGRGPGAPSGTAPGDGADTGTGTAAGTAPRTGAGTAAARGAARPRGRGRDADGMAVASFVLGLAGLLVFNFVLGPCALVLGGLAVARGTGRRGRAGLGMVLGVADLVVLAALTAGDHTVSWSLTG